MSELVQKAPKQRCTQGKCCHNSSAKAKPKKPSICCCAGSLNTSAMVVSSFTRYKPLRIFLEYIVASVPSGQIQILFKGWYISCQLTTFFLIYWKDMLVLQDKPFPFSWQHLLDTTIGSDQRCGREKVWLVKLSQQFVSISKSRCSSLRTKVTNW